MDTETVLRLKFKRLV